MLKGIDISRWQGTINWPVVSKNVEFAMIKIGGSDDGFYMDGMAQRNVIEARSAGMKIGFYVYLGGAHAVGEEVQHIKNLISQIGGLKPGEIFALDWEERTADEVGYVAGIAKGCIDAGFPPPLIYMSLSRVTGNNWQRLVAMNCGLWVAAWGNNDSIPDATPGSDEWPFWAMWQYSSTGSVPGIAGRVDLDQFNGTAEQFKQYGQKTGVSIPQPIPIPQPVQPEGTTSDYTVQPGDNLSAIGSKYGVSWQQIWALNRDRVSDPNKIFPGQVLKVPGTPPVVAPANPPLPTATHKTHTVVNGENLSVIAARYGLASWHQLYDANKNTIGGNPDLIRPGQVLVIP